MEIISRIGHETDPTALVVGDRLRRTARGATAVIYSSQIARRNNRSL